MPLAFQDGGVLGDAGVIPGIEALGLGHAQLAQGAVCSLHQDPDVAVSAEFEDEAAAGFECAGHRGGGSFGRLDPMQHRIREDGVELAVEREVADVVGLEAQVREILAGLSDHGGGTIDAEHLCAGSGDLRRSGDRCRSRHPGCVRRVGGRAGPAGRGRTPRQRRGRHRRVRHSSQAVHLFIVYTPKTVAFYNRCVAFTITAPKSMILLSLVANHNISPSNFSTAPE